jgi:hypothetical protein
MKDLSNYLFRASSLKRLMTKGRSGEDFGLTTKEYLREIWIEENFGRKKDITSIAMQKGTEQEDLSIDLYNMVFLTNYIKNEKHIKNKHIQGTPDIITNNKVIDIKTSQDIWTFSKITEKGAISTYKYQLTAYMILTGLRTSELAFCLVNSPNWMMEQEFNKKAYYSDNPDLESQIRLNHTYDDIDIYQRIKIFKYDFDRNLANEIYEKIDKARNYLSGFKQL